MRGSRALFRQLTASEYSVGGLRRFAQDLEVCYSREKYVHADEHAQSGLVSGPVRYPDCCTEHHEFHWKAWTSLQYALCSCVEAKARRQIVACYLSSSTIFVLLFPCLSHCCLSSLSAAMAESSQQSCDILLPLSLCFRELQRTLPSRPLRLQKKAVRRRKKLAHR